MPCKAQHKLLQAVTAIRLYDGFYPSLGSDNFCNQLRNAAEYPIDH